MTTFFWRRMSARARRARARELCYRESDANPGAHFQACAVRNLTSWATTQSTAGGATCRRQPRISTVFECDMPSQFYEHLPTKAAR